MTLKRTNTDVFRMRTYEGRTVCTNPFTVFLGGEGFPSTRGVARERWKRTNTPHRSASPTHQTSLVATNVLHDSSNNHPINNRNHSVLDQYIYTTMNKFLSLILAVMAIAQATAFMGTPVVTSRQVRISSRTRRAMSFPSL